MDNGLTGFPVNSFGMGANSMLGFPGTRIGQTELVFTYFGDPNGALYYAGTKGGTAAWTNPYTASYIDITTNPGATVGGSKALIVDRASDTAFISQGTTTQMYVQIDLLGRRLLLKGYNHRNRNNSANTNTITMKVSGSNDGVNLTDLGTYNHANTAADAWNYLSVNSQPDFFRYLRFNCLHNTNDDTYITVSEIELYGTLISS